MQAEDQSTLGTQVSDPTQGRPAPVNPKAENQLLKPSNFKISLDSSGNPLGNLWTRLGVLWETYGLALGIVWS